LKVKRERVQPSPLGFQLFALKHVLNGPSYARKRTILS
jgi:hypothetical protein